MTSANDTVPVPIPVGYKIPPALRVRIEVIRGVQAQQLGYVPTLIESLERMCSLCEASYGIQRPG